MADDQVREDAVAALLLGHSLAKSVAETAARLWQRESLLPTGRKSRSSAEGSTNGPITKRGRP